MVNFYRKLRRLYLLFTNAAEQDLMQCKCLRFRSTTPPRPKGHVRASLSASVRVCERVPPLRVVILHALTAELEAHDTLTADEDLLHLLIFP